MTLDELHRTCREALESGKIGTPVAICLHAQLSDANADLERWVSALIEFASSLFGSAASRLMVRCDAAESQWHLLASFSGGETLQLNAGRGSARESCLQLLLIGHRGSLRLEGGECFDASQLSEGWCVTEWGDRIRESLQSDTALQL